MCRMYHLLPRPPAPPPTAALPPCCCRHAARRLLQPGAQWRRRLPHRQRAHQRSHHAGRGPDVCGQPVGVFHCVCASVHQDVSHGRHLQILWRHAAQRLTSLPHKCRVSGAAVRFRIGPGPSANRFFYTTYSPLPSLTHTHSSPATLHNATSVQCVSSITAPPVTSLSHLLFLTAFQIFTVDHK